jgi:hypothetical protein
LIAFPTTVTPNPSKLHLSALALALLAGGAFTGLTLAATAPEAKPAADEPAVPPIPAEAQFHIKIGRAHV